VDAAAILATSTSSARTYSKADGEINLFQGSRVVDVDATEATEKPEHDQNN
jgi:hypothetical protein